MNWKGLSATFLFICGLIISLPHRAEGQNIPFTCQDQFFLTLASVPPTLNEVVIDPQTGAVVFSKINPNTGISVNAIGYRSVDNFIYALDPQTRRLVRFDATGFPTILTFLPLNPLFAYFAGDISPDGRYLVLVGTVTYTSGLEAAAQIARVDLETPGYPVSTININTIGQIYDIAFHPFTNELYGYDSYSQRLVLIDPQTGQITFPFPTTNAPVITGSLFFDALGNLFAYGSPSLFEEQNTLYQIDPATGQSTRLISGAPANTSDGCSCPYTIKLFKTVNKKRTFPCEQLEYTFEIVNSSRRVQLDLRLEDVLPPGFTFQSVLSNEVGGTLNSVPGDNHFVLSNITLPAGKSKVTILVNTNQVSGGIYRNQAVLYGIPQSLGSFRVSDNPETLIEDDSTEVTIDGFTFDAAHLDLTLCAGTIGLRLDPVKDNNIRFNPASFLWSDGTTGAFLDVNQPGEYAATLIRGCDTAFVSYTVGESSILVDLERDRFSISLGDSIFLEAVASNSGNQTMFMWKDPEPGSIRCIDCPETVARPFNDVKYTILATNELGCIDSAFVWVEVDKSRNVFFPNVFMPSGTDVENQYFFASGDPYVEIKNLSIYSRWGEKLYEVRNSVLNEPLLGWDGRFRNEDMLPGVYVWLAELRFLDGFEASFKGEVTLIR